MKFLKLLMALTVFALLLSALAGCNENTSDDSDAEAPTIEISDDGYWVINGEKTAYKAIGENGAPGEAGAPGTPGTTPTVEISSDGYWVINGVKTEHKAVVDTTQPTVTVSFDADNGSAITTQTVTSGSKLTKPTDPTKEGYIFDGWYAGDEKWFFVGYCATEDIKIGSAHV